MSEKLKPCPFCDDEARVLSVTGRNHYVICNHCESRVSEYRTPEEAIAAWNTRAFESKSGKWTLYEDEDTNAWECSVCHEVIQLMEGNPQENKCNFCPNCGAHLEMETIQS